MKRTKEIINIAQTLNTQNQLGEALDVLGEVDFEEVSRQDKSSLELHKEAMKTMSEVYFKLGKESEALKSYEQYAEILDRLYKESENEYNNILRSLTINCAATKEELIFWRRIS